MSFHLFLFELNAYFERNLTTRVICSVSLLILLLFVFRSYLAMTSLLRGIGGAVSSSLSYITGKGAGGANTAEPDGLVSPPSAAKV